MAHAICDQILAYQILLVFPVNADQLPKHSLTCAIPYCLCTAILMKALTYYWIPLKDNSGVYMNVAKLRIREILRNHVFKEATTS